MWCEARNSDLEAAETRKCKGCPRCPGLLHFYGKISGCGGAGTWSTIGDWGAKVSGEKNVEFIRNQVETLLNSRYLYSHHSASPVYPQCNAYYQEREASSICIQLAHLPFTCHSHALFGHSSDTKSPSSRSRTWSTTISLRCQLCFCSSSSPTSGGISSQLGHDGTFLDYYPKEAFPSRASIVRSGHHPTSTIPFHLINTPPLDHRRLRV